MAQLLQLGPSVGRPADGTLDKDRGTLALYAVAVAEEDVLAVDVVDGTVAGSLVLLLVALDDDGATTLQHVMAVAVEIGAVDLTAAPYGNTVVALRAAAAIVPRHKEVVPAGNHGDRFLILS